VVGAGAKGWEWGEVSLAAAACDGWSSVRDPAVGLLHVGKIPRPFVEVGADGVVGQAKLERRVPVATIPAARETDKSSAKRAGHTRAGLWRVKSGRQIATTRTRPTGAERATHMGHGSTTHLLSLSLSLSRSLSFPLSLYVCACVCVSHRLHHAGQRLVSRTHGVLCAGSRPSSRPW